MAGYYQRNPHYDKSDISIDDLEAEEQFEKARDQAFKLFADATKDDLQAFTDRVVYLQAYAFSPLWERERNAAKQRYSEATKEARELMERTIDCLMESGEVSGELDIAWAALCQKLRIYEAAE